MIERLELEKFTAFESLDLHFSPGINVMIGQNGTGKTHILKILYTVLAALFEEKRVSDKIAKVFLPKDKSIGRLVKRSRGRAKSRVIITRNTKKLGLYFSTLAKETLKWRNGWRDEIIGQPIYIPVKEMLSNAPGFLSLYENRELHFDETYRDIILKAFTPPYLGRASQERKKLLNLIQLNIDGKVILKKEQFFLKNKQGELEFDLLAEGMRKLGLLWLLINNEVLIEGSTLFWDEPEANLNPSMLETLVKILLQLQNNGVQIFIATHNYVLLKEFDLQKSKKDNVSFFSLHRDVQTKNIAVNSGNNYIDIVPNKISEAYTKIYDDEVTRSLGGKVK